ncbi:amidohydrolase/deacetylase family metallohydrolase [Virgibacillus halophilus]|uniref:amidohydrolase/deacetylase family metallohydrolase n=1 Tax=Tigheibacillus halophilus TaxID=361280 RepID=UPI003630C303
MKNSFILRNVKRIDGNSADIAITDGKISNISPAGGESEEHIIDFQNKVYVSSGWIDMHVHAFPEFDPYGDDMDEIGYKSGVTTIVDAGSTGADRINDLMSNAKDAKTNLLAFLNISRIGLKQVDELANLSWLDEGKLLQAIENYGDAIVGLKARISKSVVGPNGVEPLKIARKFSDDTSLPLMVHIGSGPPEIKEVLQLLKKNDVITHFLNGKANNVFDTGGNPLPELLDAIKRGIHLDIGHGNASFSFHTAEQARASNVHFNTISTDIYRKNRLEGPVYSMANVLTKFLYLGYSLKEIIDGVTVNAANWLRRPELGKMRNGQTANLTLFSVEDRPVTLFDSEGESRKAEQQIVVKGVVINGEYIAC